MPASAERRAQQEHVLRELRTRLQELWHEWPGCDSLPKANDAGLRYRAFALDDEIILLCRDDEGHVEVTRRTKFERKQLRALHNRILAAFDDQDLDDKGWRELLEPVAEALLPGEVRGDASTQARLTTYALHGLLQTVPMALLPLRGDEASEEARWLGQSVTVALQPAGAQWTGNGRAAAAPLFVVDPRSNLPAAPRLLETYRHLFPQARVLEGPAATNAAFRDEAANAGWLHVDAHGSYDPVCPQLSALQLADGPLRWIELADTPMNLRFAHLSGCHTGRWPITPDSGSYGIAGLVTRLGSGWAIASRSGLSDEVAMDFNRVFYRDIDVGESVRNAYQRALVAVAEKHPAGAWGGLLLLRAAGVD